MLLEPRLAPLKFEVRTFGEIGFAYARLESNESRGSTCNLFSG